MFIFAKETVLQDIGPEMTATEVQAREEAYWAYWNKRWQKTFDHWAEPHLQLIIDKLEEIGKDKQVP